ncbi:MAG: GTPase Era [Bacteroidales bacterium]
MTHKAGYVNIIGNPNAGKSTLMNALLGTQLSIISPKAQTTRHRILGMLNTDDYQIVFSDTPGMVNPHYKLQETMMDAIEGSLHDADAFILLTEMGEDFKNVEIIEKVKQSELPILLLINKIDLSNQDETALKINYWKEQLPQANILPISALHGFNVEGVLDWIVEHLPENPPYFPKDEISDRNVRFFVSEIIREKILIHYQKEIPYAVEVYIESYEEGKDLDKIRAIIYVERESQKIILIGKSGLALKRVASEARRQMEKFLGKKVFLETHVKVLKNWRDSEQQLKNFGYSPS